MLKKYIVLLFVFFIFSDILIADEIHFTDGSVVYGTIIRVTAENIEYDPEDSRPFDVIPRDQVVEIVYDDGSRVKLTNKEPDNKIENTRRSEDVLSHIDIKKKKRDYYVDIELGWNGYVGLGARFDFPVLNSLSINAGFGLAAWGYRASAGARYFFFGYPFGPAFGLGVAYSSGLEDFKTEGKITDSSGTVYERQNVIFDLKPVPVVNLSFLYNIRVFTRNIIYFELGYGIRLTKDNYTYKYENPPVSGDIPLDKVNRDLMEILQPGGLILSFGFGIAI